MSSVGVAGPAEVALKVGFVGLGRMGYPMVGRLIDSGFAVTVFDPDPNRVAGLAARGATPAETAAEVAARSELIGLCDAGDRELKETLSGAAGVLRGARPGSVVLLHNEIHPDTCREAEKQCRERSVELLEVMLSGFPDRAERGELTLMIGGSDELTRRCEPYLHAIGQQRFRVGPVGSGAAAKLANSLMYMVARVGATEGLRVARAYGIDTATMAEIALASSGESWALRQWKTDGLGNAGGFEGIGPGGVKNLRDALSLAGAGGLELPLVRSVLGLIATAEE